MKRVRTDTETRVWTHAHSHNKVPECSVYIIVFEMVMHEPVNQLAADKRAGPCPGNTRTHEHARTHVSTHAHPDTILPPLPPDVISSNTFFSLMISLTIFLLPYFSLPYFQCPQLLLLLTLGAFNFNVAKIPNQINTSG